MNVAGSRVSGTGTGFNPSNVTLNMGDSITISSALTLISDPQSSIGIVSGLPLGFPQDPNNPGFPDPNFVPMFGVFADAAGAPSVPEPSSIVLLSIGADHAGRLGRPAAAKTLDLDRVLIGSTANGGDAPRIGRIAR